MESFQIDLINPKAMKLLQDLEDLKLIKIHKMGSAENSFFAAVEEIRSTKGSKPTEEEIRQAVEEVRREMYKNS